MSRARTWWLVYGLGAAIVAAALAWITVFALRLERAEQVARADAEHQEAVRLALWRMDSWLAPYLAREGSRPREDYLSMAPADNAYTAAGSPIERGEVFTQSPLLSSTPSYFALHFQIDTAGELTSPQAPSGRFRELVAEEVLPAAKIEANTARLGELAAVVDPYVLMECVPPPSQQTTPAIEWNTGNDRQQVRSANELLRRQQAAQDTFAACGDAAPGAVVGPLVPLWMGDPGELVFLRSVLVKDGCLYQGFVADWPALRDAMLTQLTDLLPDARLVPLRDEDDGGSVMQLAMLPVALVATAPQPVMAALTPARLTLALTWAAVLAGIVAVAASLRASIAFGRSRSRFASAVTHELRTPLTTFRLYTEMLASGMVSDEDKRRQYLRTLEEESARLAALVENVLAHARLEAGRPGQPPRHVELGDLLEGLDDRLRRRAEAGGMTLAVRTGAPPETGLETDVEAVTQILFNLVDNACKYAGGNGHGIDLAVALHNGSVHMDVRDQGPGIPREFVGRVFSPFERGVHADDPAPGLGLGLGLSRGLARELGGELELVQSDGGACFRLSLPVVNQ